VAPISLASDPVGTGGRIAIFRALPGLGDLLCVVPALRALRARRPDVQVTYIALPGTRPLVERFDRYVDDVIDFPGFPGLPEQTPNLAAIPTFIRDAQARRFDLAIQLHGSGSISNVVVGLLGARRIAGHVPAGTQPPERGAFLPWVEHCSEIRRSLRLMAHLGWASDDEHLEFDIAPGTVAPAIPDPYVVVHPGASTASRRWSAAGFRDVADRLSREGHRIVLTGSKDEIARNAEIARSLAEAPIDLTGRTTLDELAATLRGARLLVSNDTGVAHLAVALEVPSIVVFTASDIARWSPLDTSTHRPVPGSARRVIAEALRSLAQPAVRHAA
jgi:ADP-heptose:LPS heptosyltransferase